MSIQAVSWVLENCDIGDAGAKLVLICLANHANHKTGQCWPSIDLLCSESSQSRSTVKRKLAWLAENGFIEIAPSDDPETGRTVANRYRLLIAPGGRGEGSNLNRARSTGEPGEGFTAEPCKTLEPSYRTVKEGKISDSEKAAATTVEPGTAEAAAWSRYHREKSWRPIDWSTGSKVFPSQWPPGHQPKPGPVQQSLGV